MTTIGVISDTHGLLRPAALEHLAGVDHIIHAGDIGGPDIVPRLAEIAPVTAIRGNIDKAAWAASFADEETLEIAGHRIFILHNRHDLAGASPPAGTDIVISGHSHMPAVEILDGVLYLNPGSAGPRRFTLPIALATLALNGDAILPNIYEIPA